MSRGKTAQLACQEACISEQSYCRWRKKCGGLQHDQAKRFKALERENTRLRKRVGELADLCDHLVVAEIALQLTHLLQGGRTLGQLCHDRTQLQHPVIGGGHQ